MLAFSLVFVSASKCKISECFIVSVVGRPCVQIDPSSGRESIKHSMNATRWLALFPQRVVK